MALYSLPSITEKQFSAYLASNYTGTYTITPAFTTAAYLLPMVLVKAGKFKELEPGTHVYDGDLAVSIITQADDVTDPLTTHDNTIAAIYDLLSNVDALTAAVNASGNRFHLWSIYTLSYDQEATDRSLISVIEYRISAQTLEV